jgi:predicted ATPase/DNA-binding winged helix-turn-helix (wHTH) protein
VQHRLRFGDFEVRPDQFALFVHGRPVKLGARALELLFALVERRDRIVTKEELLDVVWPGVVVEENNLAVHVTALRKHLGAHAIATIPGRGYRFVARCTDEDAPVSAAAPPAAPGTMPRPALPLPVAVVGRDADAAALHSLWDRTRWITIIGAGGIGKTTLAAVAARAVQPSLSDGALWVDLSEIADPSLLTGAVAQALGVEVVDAADPLPGLVAALRPLQLLLVLDNADCLLAPVARIVRAVLGGALGVRVLVTSQAPLKEPGEHVFRLDPLSVPDDGLGPDEVLAYGAVALFDELARAADRRFAVTASNVAAVVALCRHLEGVPLALKLAAARLPLLGVNGLLMRIADRFRLLRHAGHEVPARQQTLLAALDWSHGLLGALPQAVFRRLAVFAGGFRLDMVGPVAGGGAVDEWTAIDALAELVDHSMAGIENDSVQLPRYRMPETVRYYARLRLEAAGEADATQERHAAAIAAWMDEAYDRYWSLADRPWLDQCSPELDNVRAALDGATRSQPLLAMGLAASAAVLFMLLGQAPEARRRMALLDTAARAADTRPGVARYWLERSRLHWGVDDAAMLDFAELAIRHYRALGDRRGLALALRCAIGSEALPDADADAAIAEMLSLEPADAPPRLRAQRMLAQASALSARGHVADARALWEALVELTTQAGLDGMASAALAGLAGALLASGHAEEAVACARRLIADPRARNGNFLLHPLGTMAEAQLVLHDVGPARETLGLFVAASRHRDWEWLGSYADVFALLAASEGRAEHAAMLMGFADRPGRRKARRRTGARERALAAVEAALDAGTLARCYDQGSRLDAGAACGLALGD